MSEKLKDYQVIDVLWDGTFYKVRHKSSDKIFAWKACDYSLYDEDQILDIVREVVCISKISSSKLLRYHDTIVHAASKTLYIVVDYLAGQSLDQLVSSCDVSGKYFNESFLWYLLHDLATVSKETDRVETIFFTKCFEARSIFVDENGGIRVDCFDLRSKDTGADKALLRSAASMVRTLGLDHCSRELSDLLIMMERPRPLRPDALLRHPAVLGYLEANPRPTMPDLLLHSEVYNSSVVNMCDSEKALELCKSVEPAPRRLLQVDSPIYSNMSKRNLLFNNNTPECTEVNGQLSPTVAALALELPGYVPRCRRPLLGSQRPIAGNNRAHDVSEETFSNQWMSRLMALREREESLNRRERDLIAKEIVSSPACKVVVSDRRASMSAGITLPPVLMRAGRRRRLRARPAGYPVGVGCSPTPGSPRSPEHRTSARLCGRDLPNIFPELSSKQVRFSSADPFVESDESVTLTFYELDSAGASQSANKIENLSDFKYLDSGKNVKDKCSQLQNKSTTFEELSSRRRVSLGRSLRPRRDPSPVNDLTRTKTRRSLLPFKTPFKFMSK